MHKISWAVSRSSRKTGSFLYLYWEMNADSKIVLKNNQLYPLIVITFWCWGTDYRTVREWIMVNLTITLAFMNCYRVCLLHTTRGHHLHVLQGDDASLDLYHMNACDTADRNVKVLKKWKSHLNRAKLTLQLVTLLLLLIAVLVWVLRFLLSVPSVSHVKGASCNVCDFYL